MKLDRILLSRTDRLGDVILSTPVASAIKKENPGTQVFFLSQGYLGELLAMHPHVDGIIPADALNDRNLIRALRSHRFDAVLALFPRPKLAWVFHRSGIPLRIGTGYRWYSFLFNHRVYEHRKRARRHEAEHNLELLQPLGITGASVEFHLRIPSAISERVTGKLQAGNIEERYVVIHPGSGGSARDWPLEHFAELAGHISKVLGIPVVLTGTSNEAKLTRLIHEQAGVDLLDLAGRLCLAELAGLLKGAALFVGNSSGPLHLARMVGTPVVAFYPPIQACRPERWGPYGCRADVLMSQQQECWQCRGKDNRYCACMRAISVDVAIAKVEEKLASSVNEISAERKLAHGMELSRKEEVLSLRSQQKIASG